MKIRSNNSLRLIEITLMLIRLDMFKIKRQLLGNQMKEKEKEQDI